ncbi:exonuclease mut-7 homolog isoform X2 [Ptychodera flava]|uniref:exonuclease mut-7 homolog isoform X2 n=1 Tax=Ptychodera flava TaxID=63121 RepID=UPI003969EB38
MIAFTHVVVFLLSRAWSYLTSAREDEHYRADYSGIDTGSSKKDRQDELTGSFDRHSKKQTEYPTSASESVSPKFLHHLDAQQEKTIKESSLLHAKMRSTGPDLSTDTVYSTSNASDGTHSEGKEFHQVYLEKLRTAWDESDRTAVVSILVEGLQDAENPFAFVLFLVENGEDKSGNRKRADCLAQVVVKEFDAFLEKQAKDSQKSTPCLTPDMKLKALGIGNRLHPSIFDNMIKIYKLDVEGNDFLLPFVNELLRRHHYKEAANCVAKLNLQHCFSLKEIVLPLIYQDKANLAESYLQGCPELQVSLIKTLDTYCEKGFEMEKLLEDSGVPATRKEKMRARFISKLVGRLIKVFKIDSSHCPNVMRMKSMAGIRFLLYKKYVEKTMVSESWDELMENAVGDNEWLQEQLVEAVLTYNDIEAAVKWARHFNIPTERLQSRVVEAMETPIEKGGESQDDVTDSCSEEIQSDQFYKLSIPFENIEIIDSAESLQKCAEILFKPGTIIGIDSEWRPSFGPIKCPVKVSLLQLATIDSVFILDMMTLSESVDDSVMTDFALHLFTTPDVLKLGYGIDGDIKMLFKSYSGLKDLGSQLKRVVDVGTVVKDIQKVAPDLLQHDRETDGKNSTEDGDEKTAKKTKSKGLGELVRVCLGKPLNKNERLSDWERRPLRQSQIIYAALDAHCLVEIYELIKVKTAGAGIEVDLEPPLPKKERKAKKSKEGGNDGSGSHGNSDGGDTTSSAELTKEIEAPVSTSDGEVGSTSIPASEFSVVCDTMLQGLGRQLRCCGVDVRILDNTEDHDEAAKLKSQVANGMCYNVKGCTAKDQVQEVLQKFKVEVKPTDIFSRCQVCNSRQYICISVDLMRKAMENKRSKNALESEPVLSEVDVIDGTNKEYAMSLDSEQRGQSEKVKGESAKVQDVVHLDGADVSDAELENDTENADQVNLIGGESPNHSSSDVTNNRDGDEHVAMVTSDTHRPKEVSGMTPVKVTQGIIQSSWLPSDEEKFEGISEDDDDDDDDDEDDEDADSEFVISERPARPAYKPAVCTDITTTMINTKTWKLDNGQPIQIAKVPDGVLDQVDLFYACARCGKVFWEGKHYKRVFHQFAHVLDRKQHSA